jgi:hypothetical protein
MSKLASAPCAVDITYTIGARYLAGAVEVFGNKAGSYAPE